MYFNRICKTGSLFILIVTFGLHTAGEVQAQYGLNVESDTLTQTVLIHPPVATSGGSIMFSREHKYNSNLGTGDQLGRDFALMKLDENRIMRGFKPGSGGTQNKDWYTWRKNVLAPFGGTVTQAIQPDSTNQPGKMNPQGQPGVIVFEDEEGVSVAYIHVREIAVEEGQQVEAGEVVAKIGNNGNSIAPHVHVGAWKGETPLQIQVDLYANERTKGKSRMK